MFTFACIAGGFILASTMIALLAPSGPQVTLSDIARRMENMRGLQPVTCNRGRVAKKRVANISR
jgi:hypothetical protein